ncbi:MAG: type IV pilus assembly protein PilM [Terriglobia bacterium]
MGLFGGKKSKPVVGLDIGSSAVKAVELKKAREGYELVSVGLETLTPDTVVDGAIIDAPVVSSAIEQKIKNKNVVTSVSGHSVIIKKVSMPALPDDELYDQVYADAGQYIPFDIADVNLDYQVLELSPMGDQVDILLVAVKKEKILDYTSALSQAGRIPALVDVDAFALQNAYEFNYEPEPDTTAALLNIGASVMNINIVRNRPPELGGGAPIFTRDVSVGGNQYTDALQKELELTFEDAENLKRGQAIATVSDEQKISVLRSVSEILALEIQKTFDFFRATASGETIHHIFVAGGSARVPGLLDMLKEEFQVAVDELDPFRRITYNPAKFSDEYIDEIKSRLAVAVGLGLRSFDLA